MVTVCRARRSVGSGMDCAVFCAEVRDEVGSTCPFQSLTARPGAVKWLTLKVHFRQYLATNQGVGSSNLSGRAK